MDILKYAIKSKLIEGKKHIFDSIRRKYVFLTPEELVRQKFIRFLIEEKGYPKSLIKVEGGHNYGPMKKRTDILCYNNLGTPVLLIECKSFKVQLSQNTLEQLSVYNQSIKAEVIGITNGISHFFYQVDYEKRKLNNLETLPDFKNIV